MPLIKPISLPAKKSEEIETYWSIITNAGTSGLKIISNQADLNIALTVESIK